MTARAAQTMHRYGSATPATEHHLDGESNAGARAEKLHRDGQSSADKASQIEATAAGTEDASRRPEQRRLCIAWTKQRQRQSICIATARAVQTTAATEHPSRRREQRRLSIVTAGTEQRRLCITSRSNGSYSDTNGSNKCIEHAPKQQIEDAVEPLLLMSRQEPRRAMSQRPRLAPALC